jgi:hypothetical protein
VVNGDLRSTCRLFPETVASDEAEVRALYEPIP